MFNIRSVDLNLLPVFEAVYEEQSLSRAAQRLAMTQSVVSHAVTRLRALFQDELFVRHSRGVVPTSGADIAYGKVRTARWDRFGRPAEMPKYGNGAFPTVWWWDAEKAARTRGR